IPFAVMATAALVVVWHAGALSDRKGRRFAVIPAVAVTALASLAIGFAGSSFVMIAAMGALGLASGYMRPGPTAMVADVSSLPERGVAVGGYRIAQDVGSLVGPITAGWLAETAGFASGLVLCAAMAGVVFVMMLLAEETAPAVRRARA
ncbi:MAG TPA: MFS transporter, partial [Actinomycetota bacterium]|nr:MFS transporter [Actinomycetota bacterium]